MYSEANLENIHITNGWAIESMTWRRKNHKNSVKFIIVYRPINVTTKKINVTHFDRFHVCFFLVFNVWNACETLPSCKSIRLVLLFIFELTHLERQISFKCVMWKFFVQQNSIKHLNVYLWSYQRFTGVKYSMKLVKIRD